MANRFFQQFRFSLEKYVVDLYSHISFDVGGVPSIDPLSSKGIKSVTQTGPGAYDVVLQDTYYRFLTASNVFVGATPAPGFRVSAETVTSLPSPTISVLFTNSAGVATNPTSSEAYMHFTLSNSGAL